MASLVPIPWQPALFLTPHTLSYLLEASRRLGQNIFLQGSDAAWRSYARQAYLYDQYKNHGGNVASSPDPPGQRNHMRGAAFDAIRTDATAQAAFRAVGLVRDAAESWHWNDPTWASMPIIPTNTSTAGGGSTPLPPTNPPGDDQEMISTETQAWFNVFGRSLIDQITGNGAYSGDPLTINALVKEPSKGILVRNATNGAVVWANLETGKWVGLAQGYPELLKSLGLIESADGTVSPNLNVPDNVFGYLESTAASVRGVTSVAPQPVDVAALAAALAPAVAALIPDGASAQDIANELAKRLES